MELAIMSSKNWCNEGYGNYRKIRKTSSSVALSITNPIQVK
jgi:hypothetical protein